MAGGSPGGRSAGGGGRGAWGRREGRGEPGRKIGGRRCRGDQGAVGDRETAQVEAVRLEGEEEETRAVRRWGGGEGRPLGSGERDGRLIGAIERESPEVDEAAQADGGVDGATVGAPGGRGDGALGRRRQILRLLSLDISNHQAPDAFA